MVAPAGTSRGGAKDLELVLGRGSIRVAGGIDCVDAELVRDLLELCPGLFGEPRSRAASCLPAADVAAVPKTVGLGARTPRMARPGEAHTSRGRREECANGESFELVDQFRQCRSFAVKHPVGNDAFDTSCGCDEGNRRRVGHIRALDPRARARSPTAPRTGPRRPGIGLGPVPYGQDVDQCDLRGRRLAAISPRKRSKAVRSNARALGPVTDASSVTMMSTPTSYAARSAASRSGKWA